MIPLRTTAHEVVTVVLGSTPKESRDMRCIDCGRIVFNYYSDVHVIIPGEMRAVSRPLDIMCSRCHLVYRIV